MYIMCVILCLFGALTRRVGALQISVIIISKSGILVGDFPRWVKPCSVIVESQEECGFSRSILKS